MCKTTELYFKKLEMWKFSVWMNAFKIEKTRKLSPRLVNNSFSPNVKVAVWLHLNLRFWPTLTFDQLPVVQSAGQGMCVLQEDSDSGLGMCSQLLGSRAFCSSALNAWMQRTVLLVWPELPQLAEHFCHSPTHHLHNKTQRLHWFQMQCYALCRIRVYLMTVTIKMSLGGFRWLYVYTYVHTYFFLIIMQQCSEHSLYFFFLFLFQSYVWHLVSSKKRLCIHNSIFTLYIADFFTVRMYPSIHYEYKPRCLYLMCVCCNWLL